MSACNITITTTADGVQSRICKTGEWTSDVAVFACLSYQEEQASVQILIKKGEVQIQRKGDYTLRLTLREGELLQGHIGIGGSEGEVFTNTKKIEYVLKEKSVLLFAHYLLIIGCEEQEMKIRLKAERID